MKAGTLVSPNRKLIYMWSDFRNGVEYPGVTGYRDMKAVLLVLDYLHETGAHCDAVLLLAPTGQVFWARADHVAEVTS